MKRMARRAGLSRSATAAVDIDHIEPINDNRMRIEDLSTEPDGLFEAAALDVLTIPPRGNAEVDMSPVGGVGTVPANVLRLVRSEIGAAHTFPRNPPLQPRPTIGASGVIDAVQLERAMTVVGDDGPLLSAVLAEMIAVSERSPGAIGLLVEVQPNATVAVSALDIDRRGRLVTRLQEGLGAVAQPVAELDARLRRLSASMLSQVIGRLPPNVLSTTATRPTAATTRRAAAAAPAALPVIERVTGAGLLDPGGTRVRGAVGRRVTRGFRVSARSITIDMSGISVQRASNVADAIRAHAGLVDKPIVVKAPPVPLPIATFRADLLARSDPRLTVPRRMQARIRLGDHRRADELGPVMAAPEFPTPMYRALARHAREFLLPGAGQIPPTRSPCSRPTRASSRRS